MGFLKFDDFVYFDIHGIILVKIPESAVDSGIVIVMVAGFVFAMFSSALAVLF